MQQTTAKQQSASLEHAPLLNSDLLLDTPPRNASSSMEGTAGYGVPAALLPPAPGAAVPARQPNVALPSPAGSGGEAKNVDFRLKQF